MMIIAIVNQLKKGSIKNVFEFSSAPLTPSPPYVIVKEEQHPAGIGIRCIVHYPKGKYKDQNLYTRKELSDLLKNWRGKDSYGNYFIVRNEENEFGGPVGNNDDGTISTERLFYAPSKLH